MLLSHLNWVTDPRLAINRRSVCKKLSVSTDTDTSKWTARLSRHVKIASSKTVFHIWLDLVDAALVWNILMLAWIKLRGELYFLMEMEVLCISQDTIFGGFSVCDRYMIIHGMMLTSTVLNNLYDLFMVISG